MNRRRLDGPVSGVSGTVAIPTSKSLTNRALIAAAAADGGRIERPLDCEDTRLLAGALRDAGWRVDWHDAIEVFPRRPVDLATVDLGNSGTGSRLILGLLACVPGRFRVDGTPRLRERPMAPLVEALESLGSEIRSRDGHLPVEVIGRRLPGGPLRLRPGVSSQFVSALMLAAPLMETGLDLELIGRVPSRPYIDLTHEVLSAYGADVNRPSANRWSVSPGGLTRTTFMVEGDWSAAAFPAAAVAVVGGSVTVGPLFSESLQGDRALCTILESAGVVVGFDGEQVEFSGRARRVFDADLTDTPDLFPALAVVAASGPAGSVLRGLDHLKHKESDRLTVMIDNLERLGAEFEIGEFSVRVRQPMGRRRSNPVEVTAANDHRIAMAMAVAALGSGRLDLDDDGCVAKSFPGFWEMWEGLISSGETPP